MSFSIDLIPYTRTGKILYTSTKWFVGIFAVIVGLMQINENTHELPTWLRWLSETTGLFVLIGSAMFITAAFLAMSVKK